MSAIGYLRECFESDNGNRELWNIFSTKVEQLALAHSPFTISDAYGDKVLPILETYRREKTFRHLGYFIVGKQQSNRYGKQKVATFCAPLFSVDASLSNNTPHESNRYQQVLDTGTLRCHDALLALWADDKQLRSVLSDTLMDHVQLEGDYFHADADFIINTLNQANPELDLQYRAESFTDKASFNACFKGLKVDQYFLVPMTASAVIERSLSSRGILDELNLLEQANDYSAPLKLSLGYDLATVEHEAFADYKPARCEYVPGLLSEAQQNMINAAAKAQLSMMIGPPGTGKSYTIASLALERFMQGESVLIVSQNEHAIDVIKEKITETFGLSQGSVMRAGTKDYHRQLKQLLDQRLQTRLTDNADSQQTLQQEMNHLNAQLKKSETLLNKRFRYAENEGKLFQQLASGTGFSLLAKIKLWWGQRYLNKMGLLQGSLSQVQALHQQRDALVSNMIDRIAEEKISHTLKHHRRELTGFKSALSARTSARQEKILSSLDFSILLESMPIWLSSLEGLHKTLPLTRELFDLVIIDEATQCDVASCLPALQRGKRALIVGDPKQLRHISFLSKNKQQQILQRHQGTMTPEIADRFDISFRDHSMIDVAQKNIQQHDAIIMLNEHYRSAPEIIRFSNQHFYQNQLRLMTEKPTIKVKQSVEVIQLDHAQRVNGINQVEAEAIITKLRQLINQQGNVSAEYKLSIGVLGFFRAQAEFIQDLIFQNFELEEIMQHKLRCGTPYAFQGEERDIMLISCGVDENSVAGSFNYLNRPDVFNVGITRARELQLIFLSCPADQLPEKSLLAQLVDSISQRQNITMGNEENQQQDVNHLIQRLRSQDYQVLLNYPVAGIEMDMVVMKDDEVLAIDLIGFAGDQADAFHLERYKIFERAGLKIIPLCVTSWHSKQAEVLHSIAEIFQQLRKENTLNQLSAPKKLGLWSQLLGLNPILAEATRAIENNLLLLKAQEPLKLLEQIIAQYKKVLWILTERLNPEELTYIRYTSVAEQVLLAVLDNFTQWSEVAKIFYSNTEDKTSEQQVLRHQQQALLDGVMQENSQSLLALEKMTLEWGLAVTKTQLANSDIQLALTEFEHITQRVEHYR